MAYYQRPDRFLNLEDQDSTPDKSAVWMLPLPLERTTCFMSGTGRGPAAILQVSYLLELYDEYVKAEGAIQYGIHTLSSFLPQRDSVQEIVAAIQEYVGSLPLEDKLLVTLGGEHTITAGVVAGLAPKYNDDLVLVQLDAHCDLRDTYEGTAWSHGCAIRRCLPHVSQVLQFGIRTFGQEEIDFLKETDKVQIWSSEAIRRDRQKQYLSDLKNAISGKSVYLTIDVDGFDPSVIPDTGTPYPGGLGWHEGLELIRTVAQCANVVAFDCVEFSCPDQKALGTAHTVAVLVYKTMNAIMAARGKIQPSAVPACLHV